MSLFRSIKIKLIIFSLCISLIPIAIITTLYYFKAKGTLKYQILEELKIIAESKSLHISSFMETNKVRISDFSTDGCIREKLGLIVYGKEAFRQETVTRLNKYLIKNKLPVYRRYLTAIVLVDKYGKVVSSTSEELIGMDMADQELFKQAISKKYGEPYVGRLCYHDRNYLCVSAPIISRHHAEAIGVIINMHSFAVLNEITADSFKQGKTGEVYLVNRDKIMLTESRFIKNASFKQLVDTEPVRRIIDGKEIVALYKDYRGVPVIGASINMPEYGWILIAEMDKTEVFALLKTLGIVACVLGGTCAVAVIGAGVFFVVSTSRPILDLTNATKRFAGGELDYRVKIAYEDEIGDLARSFNAMADELQREISEHKRMTIELQKSEARLINAQRISSLGNWEWRREKDEIYWSDGVYRIFGLVPQTDILTYGMFLNYVHPDDREFVKESVHRALYEKRPYRIDHRIVLSDGSVRIVHEEAEIVFNDTGEAIQMKGTIQDITERKQIEEELKILNESLEQRVVERTAALAKANEELRAEIVRRKGAEEQLHDLSQRLKYHVENSPLAVIEWDREYRITYWTEEAQRVFGWSSEEVLGKRIDELRWVYEEDRGKLYQLMGDMLNGTRLRNINKNRNYRKDGSVIYCEWYNSALLDSSGKLVSVLSLVLDVTDQKNAEAALQQSEEQYRLLFENNPSPMWVFDQETLAFLAVNDAAIHHYGYSREEFLRMTIKDIRPPECIPRLSHYLANTPLGFGSIGEWKHCKKDGTLIDVEITRNTVLFRGKKGVLVLMHDITDRKRMEENLRDLTESLEQRVKERTSELVKVNEELQGEIKERKLTEEALRISESKHRLLLENLPQRIFYKDKDLVYVSCNENLARDLHIRPEEIYGKTDYDLYPKNLADTYRAYDNRIMKSGKTEGREEKYFKDGREFIIHMVRTPIKDEGNKTIGILGTFLDITEKVALERESILNRQLASLGELAASIGHEINNPITGVINCAQILFNKGKEGSKERDIANRIIKEGNRIAKIVHSLLFFAGPGDVHEEKSKISLHEIVSDVLILINAQLRKEGIKVKLDITPKLPEIIAHPQQIQQVFLNIISNARYALNQKYSKAHDSKILEILGEEITMDDLPWVKITFYDHGTGIPARIKERITEPFFTTKPRGIGTGLGLGISQGIINNHGGRLTIDTLEGEFTKVAIILPVKS